MEKNLWNHVTTLRTQSPLIHNITNLVVMNQTANALLAVNASPVMAHAHSEVKDMVRIAQGLLINLGTLDEYWIESMLRAAEAALSLGKPWVLDPVGAGATPYRDQCLKKLLAHRPSVIRGNGSEIMALARTNSSSTKGVDSTASSLQALYSAQVLVEETGAVVCISGETDIIVDRDGNMVMVDNGHPMMTKVTGMGCTASALIAAFAAVVENKTEATAAAMVLLGIAGEWAAKNSQGPGSFQANLLDKLHNIRESEFEEALQIRSK